MQSVMRYHRFPKSSISELTDTLARINGVASVTGFRQWTSVPQQ